MARKRLERMKRLANMPGGLFKKRRGSIWTAAAEHTPDGDNVIDLFSEDDPLENSVIPEGPAPEEQETPENQTPIPEIQNGTDGAEQTPDDGTNGSFPKIDEPEESLKLFGNTEKKTSVHSRRERRIWALILTLLILAFGVFAFISLRVGKIEVYGNEQLSKETIVQAAGIENGESMFFIRRHSYEDKLCEHPYIAEAQVELEFPDTVNITVGERKEAAVIMGLGSMAVIDADGYVLSIGQRASFEGLVKIYGVGAAGYQVNGHIGDMDDYASHALTALIAAIKESQVQDVIESVDLSNTLSVTMLAKSGVTVNLGTAEDLKVKLQKLAVVMPELEQRGYSDGTLYVYTHGSPIYSPPYVPVPIEDTGEETGDGEGGGDTEYTYVPSDRPNDVQDPKPSPTAARNANSEE